ncbi:hypothetical protein PP641_gp004 [Arthrobacter phage SilentRX]|uniref:Uncharacterized protein n=1 Tax=Arthrobacter phage SilentRX TaxID=2836091 RepID=A0A8F3E7C8_9CAUD|nr:hypothetical protein PP641_gp004 [Arthrobacter phage SilentRX]QWY82750.1 hypothetical protein SEA_SILENTRX_4 [Arthrobacter phage SilentRX]
MIDHIIHGEKLLKQARSNRRFWAIYTLLMVLGTVIYALSGLQAWFLGGLILLGAYMVNISHRNVRDRERFLAGMNRIYAQQERGAL